MNSNLFCTLQYVFVSWYSPRACAACGVQQKAAILTHGRKSTNRFNTVLITLVSSHRLKLFDTRFAENLLVALETLKKETEEQDSMKRLECEKLFNQTQILQFLPTFNGRM